MRSDSECDSTFNNNKWFRYSTNVKGQYFLLKQLLLGMFVIGITGGICSGKSTVTKILSSLGLQILDADKLGHKAYEPGSDCQRQLIEHFGECIVGKDGQVNRQILGSIVFSDTVKMKELQGIVWPEIRKLIAHNLGEFERDGVPVVILEAAVMIEAGWQDMVSTLWVINADRDIAMQRLMNRNGLSEEEARKRIESQLTNEQRGAYADSIFENSSPEKTVEIFEKEIVEAYNSFFKEVI